MKISYNVCDVYMLCVCVCVQCGALCICVCMDARAWCVCANTTSYRLNKRTTNTYAFILTQCIYNL